MIELPSVSYVNDESLGKSLVGLYSIKQHTKGCLSPLCRWLVSAVRSLYSANSVVWGAVEDGEMAYALWTPTVTISDNGWTDGGEGFDERIQVKSSTKSYKTTAARSTQKSNG
ncbi:hypothetical protein DAPPUDRAFT_249155 [Daphnia pulex]|uniref:Uncharacterized protein n=1 Tax=Daphnia pulex TaxID=6669 RepID=E9GVZ9_DAPPU|nr:hypothetical protein DAPPUDRAFT_249155 [Daphnia pulex]|eukprot:EFX76264.1 hypothetical protein DAPPUDRAFT_249155 [Daphnia pulex]